MLPIFHWAWAGNHKAGDPTVQGSHAWLKQQPPGWRQWLRTAWGKLGSISAFSPAETELLRPEGTSKPKSPSGGADSSTQASRAWPLQSGLFIQYGWAVNFSGRLDFKGLLSAEESRGFSPWDPSIFWKTATLLSLVSKLGSGRSKLYGELAQRSEWPCIGHKSAPKPYIQNCSFTGLQQMSGKAALIWDSPLYDVITINE